MQEGFRDTEDLDGLFSGYSGDGRTGTYDARAGRWRYACGDVKEEEEGKLEEQEWIDGTPMYRMLRQALGMHGHSLDSGAGSLSGNAKGDDGRSGR